MPYKIKSVNIRILISTTILLLLVAIGGTIYLSSIDIVSKNNPFLALLFFGGLIGAVFNFILINHKVRVCVITKESIIIDNAPIAWTDLKSYKVDDASPAFKTLKFKTRFGKTIHISHRKKFSQKDDFEPFVMAFENQVSQLRHKGFVISKIPSFWDTSIGKVYGYILVALVIAFTLVLFNKDGKANQFANYLIFMGLAVPLLIRIFKKKK